ncbi:MAG: hypothetical protein HYY85_21330 [Deltaproteobacteria bacterium]|nr:hypothetical protein [Deltaproteobacteria bacterium]
MGIQAVFRTEDGLKVGFGSEPSDVRLEGVKRALDKARQGAVIDPEFRALPGPTGEKRSLRRYHDPRLMKIRDEDLVDAGWRIMNGALRTFATSERLRELAGSEAGIVRLGLILGGDVTILQERAAVGSFNLPRVEADESTLIMAFITAMVEARDSKGSGWQTATRLDEFTEQAGVEAAQSAINAIGGRRVKTGEYRVIFGKQPVTDLLNNLVLPSVQAGSFYSSSSPFMGKLGQPVASEQLTIYDHGAAKGLMGSKGITCEGLPTGRTDLIKNGVLVGLLSNHYETQRLVNDPQAKEKLGVDPLDHGSALVPRNGFRFGRGGGRAFDMQPGVAPTNVIIEGQEPAELDELVRRVGDGLLIGRIWYTYPINGLRAGDFTCTVVGDSYIIRDGKIVAPLKPNTVRINDNIHNVLNNVIGVGRERKGTLVWAADEVIYATEVAVSRVRVDEIAGFMDTLMPGG